jgi:L-alanine-DL-glutamate epimerase-like enolase superfamily enzyme
MKITRVTVFARSVPLSRPYKLSGGRLRFEEVDTTFVKLETDAGIAGWGEACPWGHTYLPAHGPGIRAAAGLLAPALIGMDPRHLDKVNRAMDLTLPGHLYAKAPFDIACWDILGQVTGLAVVDLLGGRHPEPTPIASSVSTDTPEGMLAEVDDYRARGYVVHSVKVGGSDTAMDIARIRHLKANERPGEFIFYDVNRAWTPAEAMTVMNGVADLSVTFEQPCETLEQCAQVRARTAHPISIDERLETETDMIRIVSQGIGEIVNIKLNRVGGLTKARRLRDIGLASGTKLLTMDTGGTVFADTVVQHFAQSIPRERRLGTWLCQELLTEDGAPGLGSRNIDGHAEAPDAPGVGLVPDTEFLGDPVAVYE